MTLDDFITEMSKALGGPLLWNENSVLLDFSDGVGIVLEYQDEADQLYLYSDLAVIPERQCAAYAPHFLKANLFGVATGGSAALAYDADEEKVMLWDKCRLADASFIDFQRQLTVFHKVAAYWKEKIRNGDIDRDRRPSSSGPLPGMGMQV